MVPVPGIVIAGCHLVVKEDIASSSGKQSLHSWIHILPSPRPMFPGSPQHSHRQPSMPRSSRPGGNELPPPCHRRAALRSQAGASVFLLQGLLPTETGSAKCQQRGEQNHHPGVRARGTLLPNLQTSFRRQTTCPRSHS